MTKSEFVTQILKGFNESAEEVPSESARGTFVKKVSLTEGALSTLLYFVLNNEHVTWTD